MNLTNRPIPQKGAKPVRGKAGSAHMARVRQLPCAICEEWGMTQNSPTEAHHVKSGRFSQAKESDLRVIPLCHSHHHKMRAYPGDASKIGFHNGQETWELLYGPDYEWLNWVEVRLGGLE